MEKLQITEKKMVKDANTNRQQQEKPVKDKIIDSGIFRDAMDKSECMETFNTLHQNVLTFLSKLFKKQEAGKLTCGVFMATQYVVSGRCKTAIGNMTKTIADPFNIKNLSIFPENYSKELEKLPNAKVDLIISTVKEHLEDLKGEDEEKVIPVMKEQKYLTEADFKILQKEANYRDFKSLIVEVLKLCANMAVRKVPYRFETQKLMHPWTDEFLSFVTPVDYSKTIEDSKNELLVSHYVKPVLYCGEAVIQAGTAYLAAWNQGV